MRHRILAFPVLLLALGACNDGGSPATPSAPGAPSTSSHNAGRDCLQCHGFSLAGTVYRDDGTTPHPGATVQLTSEPGGSGQVRLSLSTDRSGNFYTNEPVSWGGGLYANVRGSAGTVRPMEAAVTGGACNSCHGVGDRIRAD